MGDIDIESYYLQLQQVEAALTSDPTNDELLKLKEDLKEVIELTKEILEPQAGSSNYTLESSSSNNNVSTTSSISEPVVIRDWKVGDKCLAPWKDDGKHYEAIIEEILSGGKVSVGFPAYSHGSVTNLSSLRPLDASHIPVQRENPIAAAVPTNNKKGAKESLAERKIAIAKQKEYLKKRRDKKLARVQVQEQSREKEKKKWQNFSNKKGLMKNKKSIFASPDTVDGKVGVGTCGKAGVGMTEWKKGDKWRKGWKN